MNWYAAAQASCPCLIIEYLILLIQVTFIVYVLTSLIFSSIM